MQKLYSTVPSDMNALGVSAAQGFIAGLSSMGGDLSQATSDYIDTLLDGIATKLEIKSPSKVTKKLGEYTGEGFTLGLSESMAADGFADDFIGKLKARGADISAALKAATAMTETALMPTIQQMSTLPAVLRTGTEDSSTKASGNRTQDADIYTAVLDVLRDIYDAMTRKQAGTTSASSGIKIDKLELYTSDGAMIGNYAIDFIKQKSIMTGG
jgi:hypothetical protein